MWRSYFFIEEWLLYPNSRPYFEPVCNPFDVRFFVKRHGSEGVAGFAALVENYSVIPVVGISSDHYRYRLAGPRTIGASSCLAFETAHDAGLVHVGGAIVVLFFEPDIIYVARNFL